MRIAPLFIATSMATLLASHLALSGSAQAAAMDPREVTRMLARAQTLDSHCKILSSTESQDLRDLVAKAEIALASKYSVAVARQTLAKGKADGMAAACDAAASAQVHDILKAGLQATTQEPVAEKPEQSAAAALAPQGAASPIPAAEPKLSPQKKSMIAQRPDKPMFTPKKPASRVAIAIQTKTASKVKTSKKVTLASYSDLAERYYVELKCHTMPMSRAQSMYENVLAQHRAALARDGASAVRKMLKNAQSRAGSQGCA